MKAAEIVELVRAADEKKFGRIPEKAAVALVAAALKEVSKALNETSEGAVAVQHLGRFVIKQVEREVDGEQVLRKRITFRAAGGKGKGAQSGSDGDGNEADAGGAEE